MRGLATIVVSLCLVAGCEPSSPVLLLEPDAGRDGAEGRDGPAGAALVQARTLVRVDESLRYEVIYPAQEDATVAGQEGEPLPVVVMIPGGFVEVARYRWFGRHLASRGFVTVTADHDANLALLASDNSDAALDDLFGDAAEAHHPLHGRLDADAPVAVFGHSLGGVAASVLWAREADRWGVLGILASFPAGGTDVEAFTGRPSLHLVGSEDSPEAKRQQGFDRFAPPKVFGVVEGMNHYAWTDDATAAELRNDGVAGRTNEEVRLDAQHLVDSGLDAWMLADPVAAARLEAGVFAGVQVDVEVEP